MSAAYFEVIANADSTLANPPTKGRLLVTAKPVLGSILNVGAKPLSLSLGADPTRAGGLVDASGNSTGQTIAPFDVVRAVLPGIQQPGAPLGQWWANRWRYRKTLRAITTQGTKFSTTLEALSAELSAPYLANWSTQAVTGHPSLGATHMDQPIVDALTTHALTRHCVLVAHTNDGQLYEFNFQRDIRSAIDIAVGMGGAGWWWHEMDGQIEAPMHGPRNVYTISYRNVSQRPDETPDGSDTLYNDIELTGGLTLDVNGFPTPLTSRRTVTAGPYGTTAVGYLSAPPLNDPTLMALATLNQRGDAILGRHQILEQSGTYRIVGSAEHPVPILRPGDQLIIDEQDGSTTGPLWIVEWDIEEWDQPISAVQVVKLASTFGDYHGNPAMSQNLGAATVSWGETTGGGNATAAGCGGLTMFFADTSAPTATYPDASTGTLVAGANKLLKSTPFIIATGSSCTVMLLLVGSIKTADVTAGDEMTVAVLIGTAPGAGDVYSGFALPLPEKTERTPFVGIAHTGAPLASGTYYVSVVVGSPASGSTYTASYQLYGFLA